MHQLQFQPDASNRAPTRCTIKHQYIPNSNQMHQTSSNTVEMIYYAWNPPGIHPEFLEFHILLFEVLLHSTGIHPESTRNSRNPSGIPGIHPDFPESGESDRN